MRYKSEGAMINMIAFGREKNQEYGEEYMQLLNYINEYKKKRNFSDREIEEKLEKNGKNIKKDKSKLAGAPSITFIKAAAK